MRFRIACGLAACLSLASACWAADPPPTSDSDAIHALIANYAAAVNTEPVDLDLASRVWLNSPSVSFINPVGFEHGWEEIKRDFYQKIMEGYFSERKLTIRDIDLHINGDSAWAVFTWHFTAKSRSGGSTVETNGRETQIYQKVTQTSPQNTTPTTPQNMTPTTPARWVLVHVHYSPLPGTHAQ